MHPTDVEPGITLASRYLLEQCLARVTPEAALDEHALVDPAIDPVPGEGQTWYALDSVLSRAVVVHLLAEHDPRADRLLQAARQAATTNDVRFLRMLDAAHANGVAYVVREWVAGRTLTALLEAGPLPAQAAGWLIREVAAGVTNVHDQGSAHLRLSPDNVVVTDSATVRIAGLSTDAVIYDSPQVDNAQDAARSDTRALGELLYAALTARWPGQTHETLQAAPRTGAGALLSPRQCRAGVPRMLDEITDRILSEAPRHGTPLTSALEVSAALTDAVGEPPPAGILAAAVPGPPTAGTRFGSSRSGADDDRVTDPLLGQELGRDVAQPGEETLVGGPSATRASSTLPNGEGGRATTAPPNTDSTWGTGPALDSRPPPSGWQSGWHRAVGIIVALVCLGGVSLFGWQAFYHTSGAEEPQSQSTPAPTPTPSGPTPGQPHPIHDVRDFDPEPGNGEEHPEDLPLALDGDADTSWTTMEYYNYPELGRLKEGVGLWVDLGTTRRVGSVDVVLRPGGTDLDLRAAPTDATQAPETTNEWQVLARTQNADEQVTLRPEDTASTRFLLLWLTKLPPSENGYRGGISQITVRR